MFHDLLQARGDTNHILSVALPQLHEKAEGLNTVFQKIDALEVSGLIDPFLCSHCFGETCAVK